MVPGDRDERPLDRGLAIAAADRRVHQRDELNTLTIEQVGEPAVEPLGGEGHLADDRVPLGLEHHSLPLGLGAHASRIGPNDPQLERRWGGVQIQFPLTELSPGKVVRDDKGKVLGVFGKAEERVRVDFDRLPLAIWVPLER